jgi:DnaJ-class molecular chaperone
MIKTVTKPEKIALCRTCYGTGKTSKFCIPKKCPDCEGSGRVYVSCKMTVNVRPYRDKQE